MPPAQHAPAAPGLGSEFWAPPVAGVDQQFAQQSAVPRSQPIPLYRRRPLQIAAVAAVIAIGAVVFAIASRGPSSTAGHVALAAPAGADGVTTYEAAHFAAKFPSTPLESQVPSSVGNLHFVLHFAIVRAPNMVAVEETDFSPALPDTAIDTNLRTTLTSFAATSGLTLTSQQVTTFQGYGARRGAMTSPSGQNFDVVVFILHGNREYLLLAPTGSGFDNLAASFKVLT